MSQEDDELVCTGYTPAPPGSAPIGALSAVKVEHLRQGNAREVDAEIAAAADAADAAAAAAVGAVPTQKPAKRNHSAGETEPNKQRNGTLLLYRRRNGF